MGLIASFFSRTEVGMMEFLLFEGDLFALMITKGEGTAEPYLFSLFYSSDPFSFCLRNSTMNFSYCWKFWSCACISWVCDVSRPPSSSLEGSPSFSSNFYTGILNLTYDPDYWIVVSSLLSSDICVPILATELYFFKSLFFDFLLCKARGTSRFVFMPETCKNKLSVCSEAFMLNLFL